MSTPLKINNAGGTEIKQFTTAEENYIAYQIGLQLTAADSTSPGSVSQNSSNTSIGQFVNTFFNEAVGTHPSTLITTGSTTTTVYQNQDSNAAENDSDWLRPLMWVDSGSQTGFKQMPDPDLNTAVDRYLSTVFTNDYPGVFKLGSASPGVDYSVYLSSVFTDTRTDGTSISYNIYRRDSYTAPSAVRPLYVRDSGGFDGIQAMTDRQIKFTFGQRAKNRVGNSKIGSYQLRSSAQGAPTDPGTWVSAGTATDTKQTTSDQVYTRDSTQNFVGNYTRNYTTLYATNYTKLSQVQYVKNYATTYAGNYTRLYTHDNVVPYEIAYENLYSNVYNKPYTANYTRQYDNAFYAQNDRYLGTFSGPVRYYNVNYSTGYNLEYTNSYTNLYNISYIRHKTAQYGGGTGIQRYLGGSRLLYAGPGGIPPPTYTVTIGGGTNMASYTNEDANVVVGTGPTGLTTSIYDRALDTVDVYTGIALRPNETYFAGYAAYYSATGIDPGSEFPPYEGFAPPDIPAQYTQGTFYTRGNPVFPYTSETISYVGGYVLSYNRFQEAYTSKFQVRYSKNYTAFANYNKTFTADYSRLFTINANYTRTFNAATVFNAFYDVSYLGVNTIYTRTFIGPSPSVFITYTGPIAFANYAVDNFYLGSGAVAIQYAGPTYTGEQYYQGSVRRGFYITDFYTSTASQYYLSVSYYQGVTHYAAGGGKSGFYTGPGAVFPTGGPPPGNQYYTGPGPALYLGIGNRYDTFYVGPEFASSPLYGRRFVLTNYTRDPGGATYQGPNVENYDAGYLGAYYNVAYIRFYQATYTSQYNLTASNTVAYNRVSQADYAGGLYYTSSYGKSYIIHYTGPRGYQGGTTYAGLNFQLLGNTFASYVAGNDAATSYISGADYQALQYNVAYNNAYDRNYDTDYSRNFDRIYSLTYEGQYALQYSSQRAYTAGQENLVPQGDGVQMSVGYVRGTTPFADIDVYTGIVGVQEGYVGEIYQAFVFPNQVVNYTRGPYTTLYDGPGGVGSYNARYTPGNVYYVPDYTGDNLDVYTGGNYLGGGGIEGYYIRIYIPTYTNSYDLEYSNAYTTDYLTNYLTDYSNLYTSIYTTEYLTDYTTDYSTDYTTDYTGDYSADYTNEFSDIYQQDYLGNFIGNFAGETIDATSTTNETYTLYVRIA